MRNDTRSTDLATIPPFLMKSGGGPCRNSDDAWVLVGPPLSFGGLEITIAGPSRAAFPEMGMAHYFREYFCVDTVGAEAFDFVLDFPHIAQAVCMRVSYKEPNSKG